MMSYHSYYLIKTYFNHSLSQVLVNMKTGYRTSSISGLYLHFIFAQGLSLVTIVI